MRKDTFYSVEYSLSNSSTPSKTSDRKKGYRRQKERKYVFIIILMKALNAFVLFKQSVHNVLNKIMCSGLDLGSFCDPSYYKIIMKN